MLKIKVCFSTYFGKITPSVGKIYPLGVKDAANGAGNLGLIPGPVKSDTVS